MTPLPLDYNTMDQEILDRFPEKAEDEASDSLVDNLGGVLSEVERYRDIWFLDHPKIDRFYIFYAYEEELGNQGMYTSPTSFVFIRSINRELSKVTWKKTFIGNTPKPAFQRHMIANGEQVPEKMPARDRDLFLIMTEQPDF